MEQYKYNAFISYSHSEPDTFVAKKLHTMLEHYRIPKKIEELSGKKIERIFRDREELPLSSDLAVSIQEALKQSEFLIVLCSPRSLASRWVQKEIETFLETHSREYVLTLLVDGEPEDVFPDVLCYHEKKIVDEHGKETIVREEVEPMAADVRGSSRKEIEKKLKKEMLRILAPMFSCSYDTLRQRQKEYRLKKMLVAATGVATLAISFTAYALTQNRFIREQYEESRRNQAKYLAKISAETLAKGDRHRALGELLKVVPKNKNETAPIVPEQIYGLNQALYTYQNSELIHFQPSRTYQLQGQTKLVTDKRQELFSTDSDAYFCLDSQGNAYVLDVKTGTCLWNISPHTLEGYEDGKFLWFGAAGKTKAVLVSEHEVFILDWKKKKIERVIREEEGYQKRSNEMRCTVGEKYIGISDGETTWIYQIDSGKCVQKVTLCKEEKGVSYDVQELMFDSSEATLWIGAKKGYSTTNKAGLLSVSCMTGETKVVSENEVVQLKCLEENRVVTLQRRMDQDSDIMNDFQECQYEIVSYEGDTGRQLWMSESYRDLMDQHYVMNCSDMELHGEKQSIVAVAIGRRFVLLESVTGDMIQERNYASNIISIQPYDTRRYIVGMENGTVINVVAENSVTRFPVSQLQMTIRHAVMSDKKDSMVQLEENGRTVVFSTFMRDQELQSLDLKETISDVAYVDARSKTYRLVFTTEKLLATCVRVYESGSDEIIHEYKATSNAEITSYGVIHGKEQDFVMLVELDKKEKKEAIVLLNLKSGSVHRQDTVPKYDTFSIYTMTKWKEFHQTNKIVIADAKSFVVKDVNEKGISSIEKDQMIHLPETAKASIGEIAITYDDKFIVCVLHDGVVCVWDTKQSEWIQEKQSIRCLRDQFALAQEMNELACYTEDGSIAIYDLHTGTCRKQFPVGYFEQVNVSYMRNDQYLIVRGDEVLSLWDVKTGKMLMEKTVRDIPGKQLYVGENDRYFALAFNGYYMNDEQIICSIMRIYYVDEQGEFYPQADVAYGMIDFDSNEVFVKENGGFYTEMYNYQQLRMRAEKILEGKDEVDN